MAATKKPKPSKKTMDVAHPDTTAPDASSRPIIVSNRSIIQDPMMTQGSADKTMDSDLREPTTSPEVPTKPEKVIEPSVTKSPVTTKQSNETAPPLTSDSVSRQAKTIKPISVTDGSAAAGSGDQTDSAPVKKPQNKPAAISPPEVSADLPTKLEDMPKPKPAADTAPPDQKPDQQPAKPSTKSTGGSEATDTEQTEDTPTEHDHASSKDEDKVEEIADTDTADHTKSPDDTETTDEPDETSKDAAAEAKAAAEAEHLQELIDEKTYFVPTKHASRKGGGVVVFLVVLIAAAAAVVYMMTQTSVG